MSNRIKILLPFLLNVCFTNAQINPAPGSKLNYTQIMFEYDKIKGADEYLIQVAEDSETQSFGKVFKEQKDNSSATLISNFEFGKNYIWRYTGITGGKQTTWNGPYKFEIPIDTLVDVNSFRCRVLKNDTLKNAGGLLSLDYAKIIIDREGNSAWYLPLTNKLKIEPGVCRDLRITGAGTFTFLVNNRPYECNLDGDILWAAPDDGKVSEDTTEYYHHDFKRLANGNYMVLGQKYVWRNIPPGADTSKFNKENIRITDTTMQVRIMFGTIIEYNKNKDVAWSWNSADYLSDEDLYAKETSTSNFRRDLPTNAEIFGHLNAFDVDPSGEFIYCGFRDLSRIVKIKKSTGKVVYSWGAKMPSGEAKEGDGFFKNQHDVQVMPGNNILLFNNNDNKNSLNSSNVVEFSQPTLKNPSKIKWMFDCKFDSLSRGKSIRNGGVEYLKNNHVLICMGGVNRVVEIDKNTNEVVWDGFQETKDAGSTIWSPLALYHVHHIPSLYPCYFTIEASREEIGVKDTAVTVKIFNEGDREDSYTMRAAASPGTNFNTSKTSVLVPGRSRSFTINLAKLPSNSESIIVTVTSNTNHNLVKKIQFNRIK